MTSLMTSDCLPHQVAESLLVADQTIDTLSAEVEEARARAAQLEGDLAVAKEAAAEQGHAVRRHAAALSKHACAHYGVLASPQVRRHAAALELAAALRLEDGYAPGSALDDLAED